jgi:hypothetical protein
MSLKDLEEVAELIRVLEGLPLTVELLEDSNIGKAMNALRKSCTVRHAQRIPYP